MGTKEEVIEKEKQEITDMIRKEGASLRKRIDEMEAALINEHNALNMRIAKLEEENANLVKQQPSDTPPKPAEKSKKSKASSPLTQSLKKLKKQEVDDDKVEYKIGQRVQLNNTIMSPEGHNAVIKGINVGSNTYVLKVGAEGKIIRSVQKKDIVNTDWSKLGTRACRLNQQ